jgi:hypothetical protein
MTEWNSDRVGAWPNRLASGLYVQMVSEADGVMYEGVTARSNPLFPYVLKLGVLLIVATR